MKSWKTTTCGVLTAVAAAINMVIVPMLDDDPATVANFTAFLPFLTVAIALIFARDNNKSSEDVGAK